MNKPEIAQFGPNGILLSWEEKIDPTLHDYILAYTSAIEEKFEPLILETVTTYHSTLIFARSTSLINELKDAVTSFIYETSRRTNQSKTTWTIPVCYDDRFGLDLAHVAAETNLTKKEVIELHTSGIYRIYFTGFLPGFLYLGGLDTKIHVPRKSTPRLTVLKGSVGIGGSQTGIYPKNSPGGWQIIGQTPLPMFDVSAKDLAPFHAGDSILFESIDFLEFLEIQAKIASGEYQLKKSSHD